jgi:hypothetical protein
MFFQAPPLFAGWPPYRKSRCPYPLSLGGKEISGGDLIRGEGVSTAPDAAVGTAFLEVRAVSSVLCLFRLLTDLKPSSWVAADSGVLDWTAGILA